MKIKLLSIIFCCFFFNLFGNKDSLWTVWNDKSKNDSLRLDAMLGLYGGYYIGNRDSCFFIEEKLKEASYIHQNLKWRAYAMNIRGNTYYEEGDNQTSRQAYIEASSLFRKVGDLKRHYRIQNYISRSFSLEGNYEEAIKLKKEVYNYALSIAPSILLTDALLGLGNNYNYLGNYSKAIETYLEGIAIAEAHDWKQAAADLYQPIANTFYNLKKFDTAEKYLIKNIDYAVTNNDYYGMSYVYSLLGSIYQAKGKIKQAEEAHLASLEYARKGKEKGILDVLSSLSQFYFQQSKTSPKGLSYALELEKEAKEWNHQGFLLDAFALQGSYYLNENQPKKALTLCNQDYESYTDNPSFQEAILECLYLAYKNTNQYNKALDFHEKLSEIKDSLLNESNIQEVTQIEMQYQFDKETLQDSLLNQEQLSLLEKDKEVLAAVNQNYLMGIGAISLLSVLGFGFYFNTRRKNQQISQQKSQLEELNTTKDQLFAIISHDLRKPALAFRGISQKVRFLLQQKEFDTLDKYGSSLEKAANSLNGLLDNLLKWALQQRDMLPYQPISINVAEVTEEIMELFEQMAAEKSIVLKAEIPEMTTLYVDQNAYATIMRNLIDNAIKFTPEGGTIELNVSEQASKVLLRIKDSGVGIAKEKLAKIFDLQKQKSTQGTAGEQGTGLGLSVVKDLVALNKGSINVQSQWQEGTTFELIFPGA